MVIIKEIYVLVRYPPTLYVFSSSFVAEIVMVHLSFCCMGYVRFCLRHSSFSSLENLRAVAADINRASVERHGRWMRTRMMMMVMTTGGSSG